MIDISRSLARHLRAVFRKLATRSSVFHPIVEFQTDDKGLRIRLHRSEILAEYEQPGSFAKEEAVLPVNALADFEGRNDEPVYLEMTESGQCQVHWDDGGLPQAVNFQIEDPKKRSTFPNPPETMTPMEPGFLEALGQASQSVARDSTRFAITNIQLQGSGAIVATDSRQLLVQEGFHFPWTEDLLIPASSVFSCKELALERVFVGKSDAHFTLRAGPWLLYFPIDKVGRFPNWTSIVPTKETTRCRLDPEDMAFLADSLPRLPGANAEHALVTVDLNGQVCVRGKAEGQKQAIELILARSKAEGLPQRFALNRNFLTRAIQLGLAEMVVSAADSPVLFQSEKKKFVAMLLSRQTALKRDDNALQILSTKENNPIPPERRTAPVKEPIQNRLAEANEPANRADSSPSRQGTRTRKPRPTGLAALIEEAECLKTSLREILGKSHQLVVALKRQRKQTRLMRTSLKALKELQQIDA